MLIILAAAARPLEIAAIFGAAWPRAL